MSSRKSSLVTSTVVASADAIANIVENAHTYIDAVAVFSAGLDPKDHANTVRSIEGLSAIAEVTADPSDGASTPLKILEGVSKLYDTYASVDNLLGFVKSFCDNRAYFKLAMQSHVDSVELLRDHLRTSLDAYKKARSRVDEILIPATIEDIDIRANIDTIASYLIEHAENINRFTTAMIAAISPLKHIRGAEIAQLVEQQKDIVLGVAISDDRTDGANIYESPAIIMRFGLVPATRCVSASDMLALTRGEITIDQTAREQKPATAKSKSVSPVVVSTESLRSTFASDDYVLIERVGTPIEFSLNTIIDREYIEKRDLKVGVFQGVNKKIIEKYDTAHLLDGKCAKNRVKPTPARSAWILETIDGSTVRLMTRDATIRKTTAEEVPALVGMDAPLYPQRSVAYHEIQSEVILGACVNDKTADTLALLEEFSNRKPATDIISRAIIDHYMAGTAEKLATTIPHSVEEAKRLFLDHKLATQAITLAIPHSNGITSRFSAEYLFTYIAHFDTIDTSFIREMDNSWYKGGLDERIFIELSGPALIKTLTDAFTRVVTEATGVLGKAGSWTEYDWSGKTFFIDYR